MSHQVVVRSAAESELADAFDWYEDRLSGLGADFLLSVDAALNAISRNPEQYPVVHKAIRRALIRKFPYEIFYAVEEERIVILAVFHARRDPRRWKNRD